MSKGYKCFNCGRGIMIGHNVSHAKNRTRKIFKPNLHQARIVVEGRSLRVKLCTKCLRQFKRQNSEVKSESQNLKSSEMSSIAPASNVASQPAAGLI